MKRTICGIVIAVAAMMSIAADVSTNSVPKKEVTAKIETLSCSVKTLGPHLYRLVASCTYSVSTMASRVKRPILRLIFCYEKIGGFRYYYERFAYANENQWLGVGASDSVEISSKKQIDVDSSLLRRVNINEDPRARNDVNKRDKVLAVRAELWFDGTMLCNYSPQNKADLLKTELPEDWYINGKYPDKIKYDR